MSIRLVSAIGFAALILAACESAHTPEARWTQPIRLHVAAGLPMAVAAEARGTLASLAADARVPVIEADAATANVTVRAGAGCATTMQWNADREMVRADVTLRVSARVRRCIHHELMHAMGFAWHPTGTGSVLSYDPVAPQEVTHQDRAALRRLYGASHDSR